MKTTLIEIKNWFLLLILSLFFSGFSVLSAGIVEDVESKLIFKYGKKIEIQHTKIKIPGELKNEIQNKVKQKFFRDQIHTWFIILNDSTTHTAMLDNTIGKSMPITFLVILTQEGFIEQTEIIKYREPYGGEIQNENWTSQFTGKNSDSKFGLGSEIQGISGATISVNSVTKGIQKLILLFPYIESQNK